MLTLHICIIKRITSSPKLQLLHTDAVRHKELPGNIAWRIDKKQEEVRLPLDF